MAKTPKRNAVAAGGDAPAAKPPARPRASVDPRFAALQTDPRFERFPAPSKAVTIDERFAGMFNDPDFGSGRTVDKRGRKVKRTKHKEDMRKYYRLQGEGQEQEAERDAAPVALQQVKKQRHKPGKQTPVPGPKGAGTVRASSGSADEADDDEATAAEKRWAYIRGVGQPSDSSSGGEGSSDEGEEGEEADDSLDLAAAQAQWGVGALAANPAERIPDGTESRRLAAVDLDWDHVRAVDIYAALRSFLPADGNIKSVTVYPSDYGLQRMQEEAAHGPQGMYKALENGHSRPAKQGSTRRLAANDRANSHAEDQADSDEEASDGSDPETDSQDEQQSEHGPDSASDGEDPSGESESDAAADSSDEDADVTDEVDQAQLRLYERSRLRFYYAIVEFDSIKTATRVYTECDGLEFQLSSCKFDLRFVPDEQSFEGRKVRDVATSVPEDYVAPPAFATLALQHTNVKLTWDKDDDARKRTLAKRVTKDELRDDDFKAYLASESEDSEPDEAAQANYRALLAGVSAGAGAGADSRKGGKGWGAAAPSDSEGSQDAGEGGQRPRGDRNMEMELTFGGGLEELGQRLLSRKQERELRKKDTVWEAYERRRREKRAAAKAQGRRHGLDSEEVSEPDVSEGEGVAHGTADPFFEYDDDPFNDPFFQDDGGEQPAALPEAAGAKGDKASSKATRKAEKAAQKAADAAEQQAEARRVAELQLLMMDEGQLRRPAGAAATGTQPGEAKPAAKLSKKERARLAKARKRRDREAGSDDEDLGLAAAHQVDLGDPRFAQLYTADDFALDPTDPRFKASESVAAIQQRRAEARSQRQAGAKQAQPRLSKQPASAGPDSAGKVPLQAMVASLKRKAGRAVAQGGGTDNTHKAEAMKLKKRKVKLVN